MPATLNGHYGHNLFDALVAQRLPAIAPENVHLEVALAAQRLAMQETVDLHIHVYEEIATILAWMGATAGKRWLPLMTLDSRSS